MKQLLDKIGFFGPIILIFITIMQLWNRSSYMVGYLVFLFINTAFNGFFKIMVKQDRPHGSRSIVNEPYEGVHKYGMPSSHAQSVFYSMAYLYLTKTTPEILIIASFISALTLYQRWSYKQHTLEQLLVGSVVGIGVAYLGFFVTTKWLHTSSIIN